MCLRTCASVCVCVCVRVCVSVSVCLSVCPSVYLSVYHCLCVLHRSVCSPLANLNSPVNLRHCILHLR